MPQPAALDEIEEPLVQAYRQAWSRVMAEQDALAANPKAALKRSRLQAMAKRIYTILEDLDDNTNDWITAVFPDAYSLGVTTGGGLGEMVWSEIHQEAVQRLAQDLFQDLLEATEGVRETTKGLIRSIARDEALQSTIAGGTAQQAGRSMRAKLEAQGIHAVTYKDGSRHGLREYAEMSMRTKTAEAYNGGTLNAHQDVRYFEIFDGPECGLYGHDKGPVASGMIVDRATAEANLISHPNCRRAFGPRPDVLTPEEAKSLTPDEAKSLADQRIEQLASNPDTVGAGQTTVGQREAQVEQDTARAQVQARKAARAKKLKPPGGGLPSATLEKRAARVAVRDQTLPLPDMAPTLIDDIVDITPKDIEYGIDDFGNSYPKKVKTAYNKASEVPPVIDLIDLGFDPEAAALEHKRLVKNARNVERRARNKVKSQVDGQGDLVGLDQGLDINGQPKVLYDSVPYSGPGGQNRPWYDRLKEDTAPGETIPVQNLTIEGRKIERGIAVRRNGRSYLIELDPTQGAAEGLAQLEKHIKTVETALQSVPEPFRGYQRGVAVLKGPNPEDAHWAKTYNKPDFKSTATGGQGGTTFWGSEPRPGTILHEFGHNVDSAAEFIDESGQWMSGQGSWFEAYANDGESSEWFTNNGFQGSIPGHTITPGTVGVTSYGQVDPREDFAESVRLYFADRFNGYTGWTSVNGQQVSTRFADLYPERAKRLDELFGLDPAPASPLKPAQKAFAKDDIAKRYKTHFSTEVAELDQITLDDLDDLIEEAQDTFAMGKAKIKKLYGVTDDEALEVIDAGIDKANQEIKALLAEKAAKEAAEAAAAEAAAEAAKAAKALEQLKGGKLTTEGLSFSDKTSVGLKKNNAYKKAIAQGKTEIEATEIATKVEQETIALKKGIDPALLTKAAEVPDPIVTVADLTSGDKVGIGVKKSNAYKKAYAHAKAHNGEFGVPGPAGWEKYATEAANEVEATEIQVRLARIKAERKLAGGFTVEGPSGASRFRPEFVSTNRTRAQTHIRKAGSDVHPKATNQGGKPQQAKANIAAELGSRMNNPRDWDKLQRSGILSDSGYIQGLNGKTGKDYVGRAFDQVSEAERQKILDSVSSNLIQGWAQSSGDSHTSPMAMQRAIAEEFGVRGDPYVRASGTARAQADAMYDKRGELYRSFARHQYEHTQEEFAKAGITEISVYRGMNLDSSVPWATNGIHEPDLQPANSWSTNDSISLRFGSTFLTGTVPVDRVLGSCRTGFGCYNEYEIVVLATPGDVRVKRQYYQGMIK